MLNSESTRTHIQNDLYLYNARLNEAEYANRRLRLESMPRYLTIVLGTACNIDCRFCYQAKTDDTLLSMDPLGDDLRRELSAFYPYLSTLRIIGGEVFIIPGFEDLVDEVAASVRRPIISISTNATLIDSRWAEKIVDIPFQEVTVSIDGASPETYARLKCGASLTDVLTNIDRIQNIKAQRNSQFPSVNFYCIVARSNYREIPQLLQLAKDHGITQICFQTAVVDQRNLSRDPALAAEVSYTREEVRELYELSRAAIQENRSTFGTINVSGFHGLFRSYNLPTDFLAEDRCSIYPGKGEQQPDSNSDGATCSVEEQQTFSHDGVQSRPQISLAGQEIGLCPNPWTTAHITELGDVHVCFGSTPVGNIYQTPLILLWNSHQAVAARSNMVIGRYKAAGCSSQWCSWREGKRSSRQAKIDLCKIRNPFANAANRMPLWEHSTESALSSQVLSSVRRLLKERNERISELEDRIYVLEISLRLISGVDVPLEGEVRFGRSLVSKYLKKVAIGSAIRLIGLLNRFISLLKMFVNWVCLYSAQDQIKLGRSHNRSRSLH